MNVFVHKTKEISGFRLADAINNVSDEKLKEFVDKVVDVASTKNASFKKDKNGLRCIFSVKPDRLKNASFIICGDGGIYSFEVSMVADKLNFSIFATVGRDTFSTSVNCEEMQQLLDNFLRENIENYDELLKEEIERVNVENNQVELEY